ncbi:hypothetical protein MSG28_006443 [Choristoneura fumiferana]|uniref:Uncharacterized protein n=1 Tax=Choristoneura fumiferana TaxID=7141 RepID=A0ACC0JF52_CHOFU|nr:hypothetical protein MSG28_006443 [Choristoneura fumiferana]
MDDKFSDELLRMMEAQNAMDEFCETDAMLEEYETSEDEQEEQSQEVPCSESSSNTDIVWTSERFEPVVVPFQEAPLEMHPDLMREDARELDYFLYYFDNDIMLQIVASINQTYREFIADESNPMNPANCHLKKWQDVTIAEFYIFLTVCMLMTRNKRLKLDEHWATDHLLYSPIFGALMGRSRFSSILYLLRAPTSTAQLSIIDFLVNHAREKFKNAILNPSKVLTVDECVIPYKGITCKRDLKKPGVKLFLLRDLTTSLIVDFTLYFGAEKTDQYILNSLRSSETVVVGLLKPYFNSYRHLYVDERYTSPRLFKYLYDNNIYACGKTVKNKPGMPDFIKNLDNGVISVGYCPPLTAIQWHHKSYTYMLTTIHNDGMTPTTKKDKITGNLITKPNASIDYSKNMNNPNLDTADYMMSSIRSLLPLHWHKKLLFHIVDMHLLNAFNCFKMMKDVARQSFAQFQTKLIRQLIETYNSSQISLDKPLRVNRCIKDPVSLLPPAAAQHMPARADKYQRCKVCAKQKKRKDTRYMCTICQVYLCACPCFQIHHAQQ